MNDVIKALEKNADRLERIKKKIGKEEVLAGLAEESAELSQAALKYRRALNGVNYTPVSCKDADDNLQEEIADTLLNATLAGIDYSKVVATLYVKINLSPTYDSFCFCDSPCGFLTIYAVNIHAIH